MSIHQKIKALSHITFICKDLEKTAEMWKQLFGAEEIYASGERTFSVSKEKFFLLAGVWVAIMEGEAIDKTYNHVAFEVSEADLPFFEKKILTLGLTLLPGRNRELSEGLSIYFYDYDNHLFELHTGKLNTRLQYYRE